MEEEAYGEDFNQMKDKEIFINKLLVDITVPDADTIGGMRLDCDLSVRVRPDDVDYLPDSECQRCILSCYIVSQDLYLFPGDIYAFNPDVSYDEIIIIKRKHE